MEAPSMPGIAANIDIMKALDLKLGRSGKRSENIIDIRKETKAIDQIDGMQGVETLLTEGGMDKKAVAQSVKMWRDMSDTEESAVERGKTKLLDYLMKSHGINIYDIAARLKMEERRPDMKLGESLMPRGDNHPAPPIPKSKPKR
jgi:hypothetical protein